MSTPIITNDFAPVDGLVGSFTWRDVGEVAATGKPARLQMQPY